ncbi:MAG: hypothetical protein ACRCWF_05370 [Beijerinckiaceae bacterium]
MTVALLLTSGAAQASCLPADSGTHMKSADPARFAAAVRFNPAPIKVGAPFVVNLMLCSAESAKVERIVIDARMPAHRHGMNYKPEILAKGEGSYEARGFLFHMPGKWEVTLAVTEAGNSKPHQLALELDVR